MKIEDKRVEKSGLKNGDIFKFSSLFYMVVFNYKAGNYRILCLGDAILTNDEYESITEIEEKLSGMKLVKSSVLTILE